MNEYLASGDTWGIPGPQFLAGYLVLSVITVATALIVRHGIGPSGPRTPRVLSPVELGMLVSPGNAVLTSLAHLRAAGIVDASGRPARAPTAQERATLSALDNARTSMSTPPTRQHRQVVLWSSSLSVEPEPDSQFFVPVMVLPSTLIFHSTPVHPLPVSTFSST